MTGNENLNPADELPSGRRRGRPGAYLDETLGTEGRVWRRPETSSTYRLGRRGQQRRPPHPPGRQRPGAGRRGMEYALSPMARVRP